MDCYGDEIYGHQACPICGADMEWETCWQCYGEGGFHDCGEDTCCCLDKEEITEDCEECDGDGGWLACSALPHTEEQMAAYRAAKLKAKKE
jgi:hypothetical protein